MNHVARSTVMPEINPLDVIAECIEKCKATTDREQIAHYVAEALGLLQIDNSEDDAFHMLGSAVTDRAQKDKEHGGVLFEVSTQLETQRQTP
jgi:hypothetical protein